MNWLPLISLALAGGGATASSVEVGNTTPTFYLFAAAFLMIFLGVHLLLKELKSDR